jgi:hypothetical protein
MRVILTLPSSSIILALWMTWISISDSTKQVDVVESSCINSPCDDSPRFIHLCRMCHRENGCISRIVQFRDQISLRLLNLREGLIWWNLRGWRSNSFNLCINPFETSVRDSSIVMG